MAFKKILVATDFSKSAQKAAELAAELASSMNAEVLLVTALEVPDEMTLIGGSLKPLVNMKEAEASARELLEKEAERSGIAKLTWHPHVLPHQPGDEVPVLAHESGCDLIVTGTHGRAGFARWFIGSVADRILRCSRIPVLTVPEVDPDEEERG